MLVYLFHLVSSQGIETFNLPEMTTTEIPRVPSSADASNTPTVFIPGNGDELPIGSGTNPLFFALTIAAPCPEYPTAKNCFYPQTNRNSSLGQTWTCNRGNYCLNPNHSAKCYPGFYCPDNAAQPIFCPRGYYCNEESTRLVICPENYFCPTGSTSPQGCHYLAYCPIGSHEASKFAVAVACGAISLFIYLLFFIKERSQLAMKLKHKQELDLLINPKLIAEKPVLKKLDQRFDIEFRNLGLRMKNGVDLLNGVSGKFDSGRTCAIIGPSGCGKTSFLNILMGKIKRTSGEILINGSIEELGHYRRLVGFVPQEDIMLKELTVREILLHSARMRLPSSQSYGDIKAKVLDIMNFLGLSHISDNVIGTEEIRGISGGERKRVNIGIELVAEPSVLFLDEPTSGLDSSASLDVCFNLKMIAQQQGLTVAAVIHSPSPDVFRQFDDLLLLGKGGQVVYMGPRISSLKYFDEIGFRCPDYTSPPDYFLEVLSGNIPSEFDPRFEPGMLVDYWKKFQCGIIPTSTFARMDKVQAERNRTQYFNRVLSVKHKRVIERQGEEKFFQYFQDGLAMIYAEIMLWLGDIMENHIFSISKHDDQTRKTPGFVRQLCLLTKRASDQIYRDSKIILFEMMLHFATGIFISVAVHNFDFLGASPDDLCATAPWNVARSCYHAVDNIKEAGMFIALGCFFAGISVGVNTFGREKVVYLRDSSSGMSAICYYLAKIIADIPRILIGAGTFSLALILYFPYRQNFISIVYVVLSLYIAAFSMSYLVSIIVSQRSTPLVGTAVSLFYAIGLSGVIPSLDQVYGTDDPGVLDAPFVGFPYIIRLFWTFSPPRWAIEAFWLKEIQFRPFKEKYEQPTNQYRKESYNFTFIFIILISLMWNTFAFILLKSRRKQELSLKNI